MNQQPTNNTVLVLLSSVRLLTTNLNVPQNGLQQYLVIVGSQSQSTVNAAADNSPLSIVPNQNQQIQHMPLQNPFNQTHPGLLQPATPAKSRNAFYCPSSQSEDRQKLISISPYRNMESYPSTTHRGPHQTQQIHQTQNVQFTTSNIEYPRKAFKCDVCNKTFQRKTNLRIHMVS